MCPSIVIGAGSSGVSVEVLDVSVFKCCKLVEFLSLREWP